MSAMERCSLIFERLSRTEGRPNVERLRSRRPTEAYTVSLFPPIDPVAKRSRQGTVSFILLAERAGADCRFFHLCNDMGMSAVTRISSLYIVGLDCLVLTPHSPRKYQ